MFKSILLVVAIVSASFASISQANDQSSVVLPTEKSVAPQYPASAHRKGMSGYVLVEFSLDEKGRARDIVVVDEQPKRVFSKAAIRALKRSSFDVEGASEDQLASQKKLYVFDVDRSMATRVARN